MKSLPIGEVLKEYGYINEEQLQIALDAQKKDRSKRLGEHLIDLGFVSEQQMLEALSDKLAEPLVSLDNIDFDINAVKKVPEAMAQKYNVIGYAFNDNVLTVATSDPLNYYGLEDVRLVSGCRISVSLATKADIQIAIERYYSDVDTLNLVDDIDESTLPEVEEDLNLFDANEDDTPVVKLLNSLLIRGYNTSASDIHIEPFEDKLHVRMRIDGMLVDYLDLNKNIQAALIVRIKILSNMDIAEKRLPQDGHFMGVIDGVELNIRVSVIPTIFGEKIVMRYLNSNSTIDRLSTFGMTEENFKKVNHMMSMPHGIIYVTGPTGSGKTTLVKLLMRFYDVNSGSILIDNINIQDVDRNELRKNIGMVLQDTWLYSDTIMENIRYGKLDATDDEVIEASKEAQVHHFIQTLPNSYNMQINEETSNISEGQKQLLTIARAILRDPKVLILDEATSSVDTRTEELIQKAMDSLMKGRTSFIIAHRLSTIKNADLILVLKDGDIIEQGTHEELISMHGLYNSLYYSQFESE